MVPSWPMQLRVQGADWWESLRPPNGARATGDCGRSRLARDKRQVPEALSRTRGEALASLCIIIPVRAARCALQLLAKARVCGVFYLVRIARLFVLTSGLLAG